MIQHTKTRCSQHGVTIVEIMVSIAISLILLAGVMQIMFTNKQTYRVQEAFARLQENGRFAMDFLSKDIRMAGFIGCSSAVDAPNNLVDLDNDGNADDVASFNGNGLSGFDDTALPLTLNGTVSLTAADVVPGTDILQIKRGTHTGLHLTDPALVNDAGVKLDPLQAQGMFAQDDILFVTDCQASDIFAATGVSVNGMGTNSYLEITHGANSNLSAHLSKVYQHDAEIMKMVSHLFYVGPNSAGEPALFRASLGNNGSITKEELVDGVEDLQLLYGLDTNGDQVANVYKPAGSVTDFTKVVSIRITLWVQTIEDNIATQTTAFGDKRLHRSFTTSVTIRNRVG